jgi:hypothetical protein
VLTRIAKFLLHELWLEPGSGMNKHFYFGRFLILKQSLTLSS